ncbi:hypothetical protein LTS16_003638 [Friedmanniomyces endolithicus]|nr:hypothetical protein LTR75_011590 [Friedmanniomyces endolithicus]KAK0910384.1 hypothetical protein LTR57_015937 [Friedmanniomyces endolithicus]KAK1049755.1 hypothetical protein LTS16_003638 [Friedmanniomyces endolithicus]
MPLAIVGASGKLGFATLSALLDHGLLLASDLVLTTSSANGAQKLQDAALKGALIRHVNWDDSQSAWEAALEGCDKLFLISSSRIQKDFGDAPPGHGREEDHFKALESAKVVGVEHVYYSSLAFANPSKSNVMTAHERTEAWLTKEWSGRYTIIREGLYNESWPLYLGHYKVTDDERTEIPIAGDSKISWTSIADLGTATAMILAAPSEDWAAYSQSEVAGMVAKAKGKEIHVNVISRDEHEAYYTQQRGMEEPFIKWWSKTYDALRDGECHIQDPTLELLLGKQGLKPKHMEATVAEMLG